MRKPPDLLVMLAPAALVTAVVVAVGLQAAPGADDERAANAGIVAPPTPSDSAAAVEATPRAKATPAPTPAARDTRRQLTGPRVVLEPRPEPKKPPPPKFRTVAPASFTVASFNVLGHSHTVKGGNRPGWASSGVRMGWALGSLSGQGVDVVGLQEFQAPQLNNFLGRAGGTWDVWPGMAVGHLGVENSIAWRQGSFGAVEKRTIGIPYFGGRQRQMPYVLLEHYATGQRVWVANFHNPATTKAHGNNVRWRRAATSIQIGLANRLGADGTPVIFTGDFNERAEYFCPLTANTALKAANGGSTGGACAPPPRMLVDWVFGSDKIEFSRYRADLSANVRRATDHPLVVTEATLPGYRERLEP
ncbi:endonuclease/exonuclease/phosphatase family protein [Nocardioides donggukensis]|uniref:Endonuclease/exonuclease/phosphatase family protein n=1 Tax=Nocardioides donggukensis TaxID=2774019 RepID=A0A927K8F4_9ACTN|nr:endonuclease/exonuclease/phosphatase family protein [Nocardioides donggukensis]MBD8871100.1 endonuclease/exonuclease/phosphatase family protein [Nocardioides donggukensis]